MSGRRAIARLAALAMLALAMLAPTAGAQEPAARVPPGGPGAGEEVVAGLSQTQVAITTVFSGSEIFIYGAVKRFSPPLAEAPLEIVVTVTGPLQPVVVRRKERVLGIWVNGEGVTVDAAPSFYAVATTGPFREVINWTDDMRYRVGLDELVRLIGTPRDIEYPEEYRQAAIRLRQKAGLYVELPGQVRLRDQTLFETNIRLPANLVEGDYSARVFLTRGGEVLDVYEDDIHVRKVGLERWIYTMAHEQSALYGLGSIALALFAGWAASTIFRMVLR